MQLGYIITHTPEEWHWQPVRYHVRLCTWYDRKLSIEQALNVTKHFKTALDAKGYAERFFRHLKMEDPWIFIGDMTELSNIDYMHYNREWVSIGHWYNGKKLFSRSMSKQKKARKGRRHIWAK